MARDDFLSGDKFLPEGLDDDVDLFRSDLDLSNAVTLTILSCLSDLLRPETRFEDHHRADGASQSTMMYFRYAKQPPVEATDSKNGVGHNMHTDLGSKYKDLMQTALLSLTCTLFFFSLTLCMGPGGHLGSEPR